MVNSSKVPEAEPKLGRVDPVRKATKTGELSSRVVVVSPYTQLNDFLTDEIPRIFSGAETDVISHAEFNKPPYILVEKKEKNLAKPYMVIDFGHLTARVQNLNMNEIIREAVYNIGKSYSEELGKQTTTEEFERLVIDLSNPEASLESIAEIASLTSKSFEGYLRAKIFNEAKKISEKSEYINILVDFNGYKRWSKGKVDYVAPGLYFSKVLREKSDEAYDKKGNFDGGAVDVFDYCRRIAADLEDLRDSKKHIRDLRLLILNPK